MGRFSMPPVEDIEDLATEVEEADEEGKSKAKAILPWRTTNVRFFAHQTSQPRPRKRLDTAIGG